MAKATRSLSGASQKKYFRDLIQTIDGISPEAAEALTGACEREIAQVRVRLPIPERGGSGRPRRKPASARHPASQMSAMERPVATASEHAGAAFDPFAFSVVVAVTKDGRDGLLKRLAGIADIADLKALAAAQHVALPEGLASPDDIRAAIVEGALQRVANRRAAAS